MYLIRNIPIKVPAAAQYRKKPKAGSAQITVAAQLNVNKPVPINGKTLLICS
jgi:hypothetical protein